jgi:two-component system, NtrC family, nitrogen regulation sensor histidine kinase NtrY
MFKKPEFRIAIKVLFLFIALYATAFLLLKGLHIYLLIAVPITAYVIYDIYKMLKKAQDEVSEFVESIHYRDFSRNFNVKQAPTELQPLRQGFNEINSTFRIISKESELHYQYLQQILELVETGIISYEIKTGDVIWMNDSFKKMMGIPYLKTIHSLEKRDAQLYQDILALKPRDNKIATITTDKNLSKILLSASAFQTDNKIYKLIAFQNINEVVDETESQAWRKLLSVMTHEIMNSIAPISSLADTLSRQLSAISYQPSAASNDSKLMADSLWLKTDLQLGIETIQKRSEGLLKFAETYRNLNKITKLNLKKVYARDLFENLYQLMHPTLEEKNIELEIILKNPDLQLEVDTNLVEQALINLLVNAIEAVKEVKNAKIQLSAFVSSNHKTVLKIADNGCGMSDDVVDKIFIPFFSTRKSGSGIGLSLCKQIMMLHKGQIQVQSTLGEGTAFSLQF